MINFRMAADEPGPVSVSALDYDILYLRRVFL